MSSAVLTLNVISDGVITKSSSPQTSMSSSFDVSGNNWVRQERINCGEKDGLSSTDRAEIARMQRENKQLRLERDLLKKATAFWVKSS